MTPTAGSLVVSEPEVWHPQGVVSRPSNVNCLFCIPRAASRPSTRAPRAPRWSPPRAATAPSPFTTLPPVASCPNCAATRRRSTVRALRRCSQTISRLSERKHLPVAARVLMAVLTCWGNSGTGGCCSRCSSARMSVVSDRQGSARAAATPRERSRPHVNCRAPCKHPQCLKKSFESPNSPFLSPKPSPPPMQM